jgi:hypothetical protein
MADATGEAKHPPLRVTFDRRIRLEFHGARITSGGSYGSVGTSSEPLEVGEKEEGWVLSPRLRAWLPPAGSEDGGAAWCNILSRHTALRIWLCWASFRL